jgi:DNA-binding XRE family transcriptional regulator
MKKSKEQIMLELQYLHEVYTMLQDLAKILIQARSGTDITQQMLGDELGVKRQQVTEDENLNYETAALHKLKRVTAATIRLLTNELNKKS